MRVSCSGIQKVCLIACLAVTLGCDETRSPVALPATPGSSPGWDEQISDVQSGTSHAIRFTSRPVDPRQWQSLVECADELTELHVDMRLLTSDDIALLQTLPHLARLRLDGPVDDASLAEIAGVEQLVVLNVPDAVITNSGLEALVSLQQLELLRFGTPYVDDNGLQVLTQLDSLRFLHLIDVPITDAGLIHVRNIEHLESFYLDGDSCTDEGLRNLLSDRPDLHFHRDQLHLPGDPQAHPHEDDP